MTKRRHHFKNKNSRKKNQHRKDDFNSNEDEYDSSSADTEQNNIIFADPRFIWDEIREEFNIIYNENLEEKSIDNIILGSIENPQKLP